MNSATYPLVGVVGKLHILKQKALTGIHLLGYTLLLSHVSFIPYAYGSPTGGTVVGGTGTITQSGVTTDIVQQSSSMAIDWSSYDLSSGEIVNYYQPDSNSLSLNRILSNDPSQINGQINANGQVILVNPNGLFFGDNASVNVGGLIASGLDISPDDFMNGNYIFNEVLGTNGTVINSGLINAATGGNVTLLGKQVQNHGVISANLGAVNMAAGKQAVLTFDSQGLIGISITQDILQNELGVDPAILNSGQINASGGRILLTASQSQDIFSRAVNTGDLTQATSVVANADGTFDLTGGADVVNSGTLNASATNPNTDGGTIALLGQNVTSNGTITADAEQGNGGNIELHAVDTTLLTQNSITSARAETQGQGGIVKILGDKVGLFDQSQIDVSGANGGGQALIGGDYQGQNSLIRNASRTYVGTNAQIKADAIQNGDGGKIINWGNDYTWFYGSASAKGGANAGNGGFVEISGMGISFDGNVDTTAANGNLGTLLFDPWDIVICDQNDTTCVPDQALNNAALVYSLTQSTYNTLYIYETTLEDILLPANANIQLSAYGDVTMRELVTDGVLDLGIDSSGGSLTITANSDNNGDGSFTMNSSDMIRTQGGSVTISGLSVSVGSIDTRGASAGAGGGDVTLTTAPSTSGTNAPAGDITVHGSINTSGGSGNGFYAGGTAGAIQLTSASNTGTAMTVAGDLTADGGADGGGGFGVGGANTIDLQASNGTLTLQGGISAIGATNGNGDITLDASSIIVNDSNDAVMQNISGGVVDIGVSGNPTQLNLLQSLTITAAGADADATINGSVNYNGIGLGSGTTPILTVQADNNVTVTGNIADSIAGGDQLAVTLTADNDSSGLGAVSTQAITTQGGDVTISAAASSTPGNSSIATGAITSIGGVDQIGGNVTLKSTTGDITVGTIDARGGAATATGLKGGNVSIAAAGGAVTTGDVNTSGSDATTIGQVGGNAGTIKIGATGAIQINGDFIANGGIGADGDPGDLVAVPPIPETVGGNGGNAGAISIGGVTSGAPDAIYASSTSVALTGDVLALGGAGGAAGGSSASGTVGTNANITINTGTLTVNGVSTATHTSGNATQTINGNNVDITAAGGVALKQSLDVIAGAGANAAIYGDIDYDGIGAGTGTGTGNLTVKAGNHVTLSGVGNKSANTTGIIHDGTTTGTDTLNVTLTGDTDGDLTGAVTASGTDATGVATAYNITTQGGTADINAAAAATATNPSITTNGGAITTTGNANQAGGKVTLTSTATTGGGIDVGSVTTTGGARNNNGTATAGGTVNLISDGGNITVNGAIQSQGGDLAGNTGVGGKGGEVTLDSTSGNIHVVGGAIDSSGSAGSGTGNNGGNAGNIVATTTGSITFDSTLTANGGTKTSSSGTEGLGGNITLAGSVDAGGAPTSASGAVNAGAITAHGAKVEINAASMSVASIDTSGVITGGSRGDGTDGGVINLVSTAGDISITGSLNSNGGAAHNNSNSTSYNGGSAGVITLGSSNNVTLGGNVSSIGGTGIRGGADGLGNNITLTAGTALLLTNSLKIEAGSGDATTGTTDANVVINGNIDYTGMATAGTLELIAGDDVTLNGDVTGTVGGIIPLNVTLTANNDGDTLGDVSIYGDIDTNSDPADTATGAFTASGLNYNGGSDASNQYMITAGNSTVNMTGDVVLGSMNITGTLGVISGGSNGISQGHGNAVVDSLTVTGTSSFTSNTNDADIILDSTGNNLQDAITLTTTGTSYSDITLRNSAANTILGTVDAYGDLTVVADGNLTVNRTITGYDTDGASPGNSLTLDFAQDGVDAHTFNIAATGSINRDNSGTIGLAINGGVGADTFNLLNTGGSIGQNFNSIIIDGLAGNDTFNLGIDVAGTVRGDAGDDTFKIVDSSISITSLQGGDNGSVGDSIIVTDIGNNTWTIDGPNSGSLNRTSGTPNLITFSQIENLTGGTGNDTFSFAVGGSISGIVDAGTSLNDNDIVDYSSQSNVIVNLANAYNGVVNAETIRGDDATSTLIGDDVTNTWNITDRNTGDIGAVHFEGFNNLTGGSAADTFVFTASGTPAGTGAGIITGIVDGGDNVGLNVVDTADYSAQTGGVVNLADIKNIEILNGSSSTLVGENIITTWTISDTDIGTVTDDTNVVAFSGFSNLTGGSAADNFIMSDLGSVSGQIDGGLGNDSIDYSVRISAVSVDLNTLNIIGIENIIGNSATGGNSTLIGYDAGSTWGVTGNNAGSVNDGSGAIAFTGFNILQGGTGVDIFTVDGSGSIGNQITPDSDIISGIYGGTGNDVLNVTITGATAGSLMFDGEVGTDTVNLTDGSAAYSGEYIGNAINGYDRIAYTASGNTYSVNYLNAEAVNDNVIAADFLVNGTSGNNTITLSTNGYQVGTLVGGVLTSRQQVNFSNKQNLYIDALAGDDTIDVNGDLSVNGMLTLSSESITYTSGTLAANTLTLADVGTVGTSGQRVTTDVANLNIANVSGDIYITDISGVNTNGVSIGALNNLTGVLDLISSVGDITDNAALVSGAALQLTAVSGNIRLDNANQLSGALDLSANAGDIFLTNTVNTNLQNISAGGLTVDTQGSLTQSGTMNINELTISNAQSVDLDNGTNALSIVGVNSSGNTSVHAGNFDNIDNVISGGNVSLSSDNSASIGSIISTATNGTVSVTAVSGGIASNTSGTNIAATNVVLDAYNGIGSSANTITTNTSKLDVITNNGSINMANTSNVQVDRMITSSGNITFSNTGTLRVDRIATGGSDDNSGHIDLTIDNGDMLGVGSVPNFTYEDADIAGYSARIVVNGGNLGTPTRKLVIWAPGDITTVSVISFDPEYLPDPLGRTNVDETAWVNFSATDTLAAIAGEQVTEVEDLDDVDPAIFTEVHNYNMAEISIKMPRDQLYEDEMAAE